MSQVHMIVGPPGTGKTTEVARQARRAAEAYGPDNVAIASLTRTAAAEIGGRDTGLPETATGTLHAHAYRALERPDLAETPEGIRQWNDEHPEAKLTQTYDLEDAPSDLQPMGDTAHDLHARLMTLRARATPTEMWPDDILHHHHQWEDWKHQTGRLDFTDLIDRAIDLGPHPARPRGLFLDEAQDFSRLELKLASQWAQHTDTTVIVADPDQCLFSFRGADPQAIAGLEITSSRVLEQSWRVPQAVHRLATEWIARTPGRTPVTYHPTPQPGETVRPGFSIEQTGRLLDHIQADLAEGEPVMVLTSCGYMLAPLLRELRRAGIPFHNPWRAKQGAWNPLRTGRRLAAYLRSDETVWGDRARAWTWQDLHDWTEPLNAKTALARGAKALIDEKVKADRFAETRAHQAVPLDTLAELLGTASLDHPALRMDLDWWEGNLLHSRRARMEYPLEVARRHGARALLDCPGCRGQGCDDCAMTGSMWRTPRVVTGTVHSVKGAECASVIVSPDLSRPGYWNGWATAGPSRDQIRRLGYVAATRARRKLTLLEPSVPEHMPLHHLTPHTATARAA
jgi:superfamily I DNA/RNA helicase